MAWPPEIDPKRPLRSESLAGRLIAGLIGVVIIGAPSNDGLRIKAKFTAVGTALG
jgi:hypothetical protein